MLSFHIKFVQTDRWMDGQTNNGKTICPPIFRYRGIKMSSKETVPDAKFCHPGFQLTM